MKHLFTPQAHACTNRKARVSRNDYKETKPIIIYATKPYALSRPCFLLFPTNWERTNVKAGGNDAHKNTRNFLIVHSIIIRS